MRRIVLALLILASGSFVLASSLAGRVLNALSGAPIRKAAVELATDRGHLFAVTDSEGKFEFTGLPAGTYKLTARGPGYLEHGARRPIALGADEQVTDAEIRLPPQSAISGRVLDEDSDPVDRASVQIFRQVYRDGRRLWDPLNRTAENDRGEYRFAGLGSGRYFLLAHNPRRDAAQNRYGAPPEAVYIPVYYPNAPDRQHALPVQLDPGAELRGIDIHLFKVALPPFVHIRGKVAGLAQDSRAEVGVSLLPTGSSTLALPPDYAFDLAAPPGQYTLSANIYTGGLEAYGALNLTLATDLSGIVLPIAPAPEITARVTLAEAGAKVNLEPVSVILTHSETYMFNRELRRDARGRFASSKPFVPGHYAVAVRSLPENCFLREIKFAGQEIAREDFEVSSSGQLEIVLGSQAGAISGTVADADGKPYPGATVTLIPEDGKWSLPAKQTAGAAGDFRFPGLRPGSYKLFAWDEVDDAVWQDPEFLENYKSRATEISVAPGERQNAQLRVIGVT